MADKRRLAKIEKAVAQEIAQALVTGARDPRAGNLISITSVKVSPDLSHARVRYSCLGGPGKQRAAQRMFDESAGYFNSLIAQRLDTRITPKVTFHFDDALQKQQKMAELIDSAINEDKAAQIDRGELPPGFNPGEDSESELDEEFDFPKDELEDKDEKPEVQP